MRISERIKKIIVENAAFAFGDADILLFGSRAYDDKQGGDIDIAIRFQDNEFTAFNIEQFRNNKIKFLTYLERIGFELSIDIVLLHTCDKLLAKEIQETGIKLN